MSYSRVFWMKNLTDLDNLSSFYWILEILHKISIEAMICGYLEPKKLRARPPNEAITPSWMKIDRFHLEGRAGFIWMPSP